MEIQLGVDNLSQLITELLFLAAFHRPVRDVPLSLCSALNQGLEPAMSAGIHRSSPEMPSMAGLVCSTPADQIKPCRSH